MLRARRGIGDCRALDSRLRGNDVGGCGNGVGVVYGVGVESVIAD